MKILGDERKKEGREQTESHEGKEMFWVQRILVIWPVIAGIEEKGNQYRCPQISLKY